MEAPAHDIAGIGVRQQRQVAEPLAAIYISNVGHYQLSCISGNQLRSGIKQVGPDTVVVVGVRRPRPISLPAQHQPVGPQNVVEAVAPKGKLHAEVLPAKVQKLAAAGLRQVVRSTDVMAVEHYARDEDGLLVFLLVMLVVAPSGYAKQSAERRNLVDIHLHCQGRNYLAPDFFRMGMP